MAQADAENGYFADEFLYFRSLAFERFGIARSVGEEDSVWFEREYVFAAGVGGDNGDSGSDLHKMAQDVALDSIVVGDDVVSWLVRLGGFVGNRDGLNAFGPGVAVAGGYFRDQILAGHGGGVPGGAHQLVKIDVAHGDNATHGSPVAQETHQFARVYFGNDGNAVFCQEVLGFVVGAPVADNGGD